MNAPSLPRQSLTPLVSLRPGDGEMAALVKATDWSQTPLGPMQRWPQSLRTVVQILLTSRYAMWMGWGQELTFLYNDAYRPTLGLKHPWALGTPAGQVWAEIWRDIGPRIETVFSTGRATYDEGLLLFLERSGFPEETYHTFSYSPLSDDSGQLSGMLCVVTEETERVIAERRIATLRDLAADLASSTTEAEVLGAVRVQLARNPKDLPFSLVYLFDGPGRAHMACATGIADGHPLTASPIEAGANLPWPAADVFSKSTASLFEDLGVLAPSASLPVGAWDRPPKRAVVVPIKQQGQEQPAGFLVVGVNPYRQYDDAYAGFIELLAGQLASGIANARAYEVERRRAEALAELDRAKTAFFSNVSHEFRTPLTLMLGPLEDVLAKPDDQLASENRELLQVVHRSGLRLQRLVNTLLDFSRIEAGRAQASFEPTDLANFTAELASSFRSAMSRAGLTFTIECPPLSQPVYVDREMWEKVVLNLVSNAFKYTLQGSVLVCLSPKNGQALLTVQDTGPGIPEEELPRLFERFHRVEGTRGRTHEGTGIGLALVQELVKLHGGTVSVTSTVGQGSTFTVSLPFGSSHLPPDRIYAGRTLSSTALHANAYVEEALRWLPEYESPLAGRPEPVPHLGLRESGSFPRAGVSGRVLLADDNADMRDYVRRLLSVRYEVTAVSNGEEARAAALANPPDLVLTDVMMPLLDGFGLLQALRLDERTKGLPILLLSARAGEESRVEGLNAGADDYLIKPFSARELLARVDAHISLARMRKQMELAVRASEERLQQVFQQAPVAIIVLRGNDFAVELANPFYRSLVQGRELVGRPLAAGIPDLRQDVWDALRRVLDRGEPFTANEWLVPYDSAGNGHTEDHWFNVVYHPLRELDESVSGVVAVCSDVTIQVRARQELERVNRELEEFAYVASHDLQEPLRMVNIYTQMILRRLGPEDQINNEYGAIVRDAVNRMHLLIRDLLTYSRTVQRDELPVGTADLSESLAQALSVLRNRIEESGAVVTSQPLPAVYGDTAQLAHVFQNLVSNSIKYCKAEACPEIRISAEQENDRWIVCVRDNGIGFQQQYAEKIFGLFKRLHKEEYPGTGLGLAICHRIVERYGGRIWAEGRPGEGASFYFSLRRANPC